MNPTFTLKILGKDNDQSQDITATMTDRLEELRLVTTSDSKTDYLELVLDDRDGELQIPYESREIYVELGYTTSPGLLEMGTFIHTDTEYQISPQRLTIRATAADFTENSKLKAPQTRSWDDKIICCG